VEGGPGDGGKLAAVGVLVGIFGRSGLSGIVGVGFGRGMSCGTVQTYVRSPSCWETAGLWLGLQTWTYLLAGISRVRVSLRTMTEPGTVK
jgi:hypothetical protein